MARQIVVFLGPTLRIADAMSLFEADYRPPARRGDITQAVRDGASSIALIDGFLMQVPSVPHKELLQALDSGVAIYGAASMGALRAAELDIFGMIGVGSIYEDYRDGLLKRDDEVAILHGPAELGYPAVSEAMVNIRSTVAAAPPSILSTNASNAVIASAQALHYPLRTWPQIFDDICRLGIEAKEISRFRNWLKRGRVDQKRRDALALIKLLANSVNSNPDVARAGLARGF